jgi:general secretion pathway protein D
MSGGYGSQYGSYGSSMGRNLGGYGSGSMYPYEESIERMSALQAATPQPATSGARTSAGAAQTSFQNRLSQIARRAATPEDEVQVLEDARIVPDERSNKLLVFANKRDMEMITNIVTKVDVLLAQVLIEAVIMEVQLGDSQNLGFSWAQRPRQFGNDFSGAGAINNGQSFLNSVTNFPGSLGPGFSYFGALNNQWDLAISAVAENSSINVVSRPRIQTSHAIPGSFFVGETVPYITGFTDYGGFVGSGVSTRSQVQQADVGFSLFVTPFITPDGLVVMEISQDFSTRGRDVLIDNNPVPIINNRNAISTLTVRDGDTIMMGGFITENQSRAKSGVPFLKDIPGVGALFRSKNNSNDRTELIVLMRARVLRTPEDAAIIASEERAELPGVSQAEQALKQANEKRKERSLKHRR